MSVTTSPDRDLVETEHQLDQLIPPTPSFGKRFASGVTALVLAVAISALFVTGSVYPNPTAGVSWSSGHPLVVQEDEQSITGLVDMPNNSSRSARITHVTLDAPGVTLLDVRVLVEPAYDSTGEQANEDGSVTVEAMEPIIVNDARNDWLGEPNAPLPVIIGPGETANLYISFRPDDCTQPSIVEGDWGIASATVDFGDGAFPPISRSIRLDEDPIVEAGESNSFLSFGGPDGFEPNFTDSNAGVLAGACEALQ